MGLTRDAVAAASARWVWVPEGATLVETDDWTLVRYPEWAFEPIHLPRFVPGGDPTAALDAALAEARRLGPDLDYLPCCAGLDSPQGTVALLEARGELVEDAEVLALDLTDGPPDLGPPAGAVDTRWVLSVADAFAGNAVAVDVFDSAPITTERAETVAAENAERVVAGIGAMALATLDGEPAGHGGLEIVDGVARLYGGGVRAEARGRGVYRALLQHRLAFAVEHGATLAITKGRVATSGPILRRAGFEAFGRERTYRVPL